MKITLSFESDFEDISKEELYTILSAGKWKGVSSDMDDYLRAQLKYSELSVEVYEALEKARDHLRELLSENNLSLN